MHKTARSRHSSNLTAPQIEKDAFLAIISSVEIFNFSFLPLSKTHWAGDQTDPILYELIHLPRID